MPNENLVEDTVEVVNEPEVEITPGEIEVATGEPIADEAPVSDVNSDCVQEAEADTTPVKGLKEIIVAAIKEAGLGGGLTVPAPQTDYAYTSITKLDNGFIVEGNKGRKFYSGLDEALVNVETSLRDSFKA